MYKIDERTLKLIKEDWDSGFFEMNIDSKYKYLENAQATYPFMIGVCREGDIISDRVLLSEDGVELGKIKGKDWEKFSEHLVNLQSEISFARVAVTLPNDKRKTMISDLTKTYYDTLYQPIIEAVAKEPELAKYLPNEMFTNDKNLETKIIEARKKELEQMQEQKESNGEKLFSKLKQLEENQGENE